MRGEIVETILEMHALVRWRGSVNRCAGPPFPRRPDRPRGKSTAAVRADIAEFGLDAIGAKRALIAADTRLRGVRRKIPVAIFAIGPELQRHDLSPS